MLHIGSLGISAIRNRFPTPFISFTNKKEWMHRIQCLRVHNAIETAPLEDWKFPPAQGWCQYIQSCHPTAEFSRLTSTVVVLHCGCSVGPWWIENRVLWKLCKTEPCDLRTTMKHSKTVGLLRGKICTRSVHCSKGYGSKLGCQTKNRKNYWVMSSQYSVLSECLDPTILRSLTSCFTKWWEKARKSKAASSKLRPLDVWALLKHSPWRTKKFSVILGVCSGPATWLIRKTKSLQ